jgi:selenocysteine lyase/cysteine desulfurase
VRVIVPGVTGFLYVRQDFIDRIEPPFLDLHAATWTGTQTYEVRRDAKRFESWETNYAPSEDYQPSSAPRSTTTTPRTS